MIKTMKFNNRAVRVITDGLLKPFRDIRNYWVLLGAKIDQQTQQTFRGLGKRTGGGENWKDFSPKTLKTKKGTWKIRYGTDLKGKGMQGTFRKGVRRYSSGSKLLQASGGFKKLFRPLKITKRGLLYGTRFKIAEEIMSNPARPVLFISDTDRSQFFRLFRTFVNRKMTF
jgi:hypothetical protein